MRVCFLFLMIALIACSGNETTAPPPKDALFKRLPSSATGISFENTLSFREDFDVFRYRNYYNGAGVAIGDINNDGLADVYLTSNMGDNKLYLNKGNFKFEDITLKAGVVGNKVWSTGVSMADVNGDGLLDIYVCNSGDVQGGNRENELFINNGDLTFTEKAQAYGLADNGFSTHALFFDYDRDGDLDCYVLNNSFQPPSSLGYRNLRNERDEAGGHKLYNNDNGHFVDVSAKAGIFGSVIGFGLGVTAGDVNQDGWPDVYVSNDFYERDYLYINNHDGTFSEQLEESLGHISMFSMGADIADLNNDGYPEIFSTDMLPENDYRLKTLVAFESYPVYKIRVKNGYYHQYMRNMLHKNNKDGTFSEIGRLAGVEATDWSWGSLIVDLDNDGVKEIFVSNGIYKDVTNQDFVEFLGSEQIHAAMEKRKVDLSEFLEKMPSQKISNYVFRSKGDWQYENVSAAWGLDEPSFSNGAAYGDLDNDGDLDLVVNNVNQELFVYQNQSREKKLNHYIAVQFKGTAANTFGVGATVRAVAQGKKLVIEHYPIRGYQSSMDYKTIVGLGQATQADTLLVEWPDGKTQLLKDVKADQQIAVDYKDAAAPARRPRKATAPLLQPLTVDPIVHHENDFNDFDQDRLLYQMLSTQGPAFATADLNHDGYDDFFLGGSNDTPASLWLQKPGHKFVRSPENVFEGDSLADHIDAVFFDADGDQDDDLYVVTGGSEHSASSYALLDHYYENTGMKNGFPVFVSSPSKIPFHRESGSCVKPIDIDRDGDLDLFVGTRLLPGAYGVACNQFLLLNDGHGTFGDATATWAPALSQLGMVSDACWVDVDNNGFDDLLLVGDWMPLKIFLNDGHQLKEATPPALAQRTGWWNRIVAADLDNDGDTDFVLGNLGLNSKFKPSLENPVKLFVYDFDQNGSIDPVFSFRRAGKDYPLTLRHDLLSQVTALKKKFVYYKDYADKSMDEILDGDALKHAQVLSFTEAHTAALINLGNGNMEWKALPVEAQVSPVYGIAVDDIDGDHKADVLMGGNLFAVKPEAGRYDALYGLALTGDGKGNFNALDTRVSGIEIRGEVRHIRRIRSGKEDIIVVVRNNDALLFYKAP